MPAKLKHVHAKTSEKFPKINDAWVDVNSGWVVISNAGKTPMWSNGFSGCVGVVMCGPGKWGALAHINQKIQFGGHDLELALATTADFIRKQARDTISDVLIYYGDPEGNLGINQDLTVAKIKTVMQCQNVIDLRRRDDTTPYGADFVYDPNIQTVYTATKTRPTVAEAMGMMDRADDCWNKKKNPFPYPKDLKDPLKKLDGLGTQGWCAVP